MAVSRLFVEIGGDVDKLNASLRNSMVVAKSAGADVTAAGQRMLASFDKALNPTKSLAEEIKLLNLAGKSGADIWAVYGKRLESAAAQTQRNGQQIEQSVQGMLDKYSKASRDSFGDIGKTLKNFISNPASAASSALETMSSSVGISSAAFVGLSAGAVLAYKAIKQVADWAMELADMAENLQNLSYTTGLATQDLQALAQVAKEAGLEGMNLGKLIGNLNEQLGSASGGDFTRTLRENGIALKDSSGHTKDAVKLLDELRAKFDDIIDPTDKAQAMNAAFGGRLKELIPLLAGSKDGLQAAMDKMKETGVVWDEETQGLLLQFDDVMDKVGRMWDGLVMKFKTKVVLNIAIAGGLGEAEAEDEAKQLRKVAIAARQRAYGDDVSVTDILMTGLSDLKARYGYLMQAQEYIAAQEQEVAARARETEAALQKESEARRKLIADGKGDVDIRMKIGAAQEKLDELMKSGTDAELMAQRQIIDGLEKQLKARQENAKTAKQIADAEYQRALDYLAAQEKAAARSAAAWKHLDDQIEKTIPSLGRKKRKYDEYAPEDGSDPLPSLAPIYLPTGATEAIKADYAELARMEQERLRDAENAVAGMFDAFLLNGQLSLSSLSDWLKTTWLSSLKSAFSKALAPLFATVQDSIKGIVGSLTDVLGGKEGATWGGVGTAIKGFASNPLAMGMTGAGMIGSQNKYMQAAGYGAMGLAGVGAYGALAGVTTATGVATGSAGAMGALTMSTALGPLGAVIAAGIGAVLGGMAIANWAQGKNTYEAASQEARRDYGVSGITEEVYSGWMDSIGISEGQGWKIRTQMNNSPRFIKDVLIPLAEQNGQLNELFQELEFGGHGYGVEGLGGAAKIGQLTGDWSKLNELFLKYDETLGDLTTRWGDLNKKLLIDDDALEPYEQMITDLNDLKEAIRATITVTDDMFAKFVKTGDVTAELAAQVAHLGGDLTAFYGLSAKLAQQAEFGESLTFIQKLKSGVQSLAPEIDPIKQILGGSLGTEAKAALMAAGVSVTEMERLTGAINAKNALEQYQPFQTLSPDLLNALTKYGGDEGAAALASYNAGFNTITQALIDQVAAAADAEYLDTVKAALDYLGTAEDAAQSRVDAIISEIDALKEAVVGQLEAMMINSATMGLAGQDVYAPAPAIDPWGYDGIGGGIWAPPVDTRNTFQYGGASVSAPTAAIIVNGNIYGYDDFADAVARAERTNQARGAA